MSLTRRVMRGAFAAPFVRRCAHRLFMSRHDVGPGGAMSADTPLQVLVLGVYMADRPNSAGHLVRALGSSLGIEVEHRWCALLGQSDDPALRHVTPLPQASPAPKFSLVNRLLDGVDLDRFDHVIVVDDDIFVREGFLPAFLAWQRTFGFALAQPARAWHSHFDHSLVLRRPWLAARQTRFVECGPFVSFDRHAASLLLPFDAENEMWGLDLVWPVALERAGLTLGIVDAIAVDHSLRGQATTYDRSTEERAMHAYLARTPHLSMADAFTVLARHPAAWRAGYF